MIAIWYRLPLWWQLSIVLVGCDDQKECGPSSICASPPKLSQVQIISAWPARMTVNGAVPACDGASADAVIVNALFISTQRASLGAEPDFDVSVRPGDNIDGHEVEGDRVDDVHLSNGEVSLTLDCVNPAVAQGNRCEGIVPDPPEGGHPRYVANTSSRTAGHDVMLLVDQSGDTRIAGLLKASADQIVLGANSSDDVRVLAFGERRTVCSADGQSGDAVICDELPNDDSGRSNLWLALVNAYDAMKARPSHEGRSKHIVVLANGPDTCAGEDRQDCTAPCATSDPRELISRIAADGLDPIHITFVQLDNRMHPGRDARQVAAACASRGHYQFINATALEGDPEALREAVDVAVANARYAWMGHWEFAIPMPFYANRDELPRGMMYALQGNLKIAPGTHLVPLERNFQFGVGLGMGASSAVTWDRRPTVLKVCTEPMDCGLDAADSCMITCSLETGLCPAGNASVPRPELSACPDDSGTHGFCCGGQCRRSGQCEECSP